MQEIVHSLESDSSSPPRMFLKIDITKAYDIVEWEAVLATLHPMNFWAVWGNWIWACMSSASFALLINGQARNWFSSVRGLRQRHPLSPYLFFLVSQNLATMLNHALQHHWIPWFDNRLNLNFNHLMFVDDLIIVMEVFRAVARVCKLCLPMYKDLIGQMANVKKIHHSLF